MSVVINILKDVIFHLLEEKNIFITDRRRDEKNSSYRKFIKRLYRYKKISKTTMSKWENDIYRYRLIYY